MYKETWESWIGEELVCKQESHNVHNPFAVAVLKADSIVDHAPRIILAACLVGQNQEFCVQLQDTDNILVTYHKVVWKFLAGVHFMERN